MDVGLCTVRDYNGSGSQALAQSKLCMCMLLFWKVLNMLPVWMLLLLRGCVHVGVESMADDVGVIFTLVMWI